MRYLINLFSFFLFILLFSNCTKEETNTVTEYLTDTVIVTVHDTIEKQIPTDSTAVIFLVRHAETDGGLFDIIQ